MNAEPLPCIVALCAAMTAIKWLRGEGTGAGANCAGVGEADTGESA